MTCKFGDCGASAFCRGWCSKHYYRWLKHGDPSTTKCVHAVDCPPGQKWCSACKSFKDLKAFSANATSTCRGCNNRLVRTYRKQNQVRAMLLRAKTRAAKLGLKFDLSPVDVRIPEVCPVLGIPLRHNNEKGPTDNSPTLDRIDNALGYVKGNVLVISFRANAIKRDAEEWELRAVADYMGKFLSGVRVA